MRIRVLGLFLLALMVIGSAGVIPSLPLGLDTGYDGFESVTMNNEIPEDMIPLVQQALAEENPYLPQDYDIGLMLGDRENEYKMFYEPWRSQAAIHAIAYDEATGFLALGGGYLYDNEVHVFRHNVETNQFDKVWDTGDSLFQSDVLSLDFGDTDLNNFIEIIAGCADGHVYVFEQRHIYDPYANTENQFDHVWTSPDMFRAFAVKVDDIDKDYRPDIIAGGWDGKVHIFEYSNHSGYPFVEAHWITYDEVATLEIGEKVYTIETGDTNANGLPEVVVGTRAGRVYVYENAGITLYVNGYPFPLVYDNHYYLNWTSVNYTWTPIVSMSVGELDGSIGDEIALVAQGQGVFTLNWDPLKKTYDYEKVYRPFKQWETFGLWGLDFYTDRVVSAWNVTYHDPINASINVPEPIEYVWGGSYFIPDASVYPYNTGMAGAPDGNYSTFDASSPSVDNATAIIDFGLDEEGTGGANSDPDVLIKFPFFFLTGADISPYFNFSVSKGGTDFEQVSPDRFTYSGNYLKIDVDDALSKRKWDYFRYAKISVFNGATYNINSVELVHVYNLVTEALSVEIGPLKEDGNGWAAGTPESDKILVATSIGEFLGVKYNSGTGIYDLFWESGDDDYYTFGAGVWDMVHVNTDSNLPAWNLWGAIGFAPQSGYIADQWSYGVIDPWSEKIFNMFLSERSDSGGFPEITAHDTSGNYDAATSALFGTMNNDFTTGQYSFDRVSAEVAYIQDNSLNPGSTPLPMIVVGGINENIPLDNQYPLYRAQLLFYYRLLNTDNFVKYVPLWDMDVDGQLTSVVNLAKTTPRVSFGDYDGDGDQDFVVSNGYVYLAQNLKLGEGATGHLNFTLVPGYFDDINTLTTSAVWGQPNLHDLDGDGDLDLVISYDNKDGSTVFINEGTPTEPKWVEHKKLMSNPGEFTNMKLLNLTDVRIVEDWGPYYDGLFLERFQEQYSLDKPKYYFYAYNEYYDNLWLGNAVFDSADSYVVATYPRVARVNFNLMQGNPVSFYNLGYHVMEDWNNNADLNNWTLSITSADTDQDGKNEIIVGDYDNNVYAFEHLVNNTYKRMFRSFDLNHTVTTDVSPYAYQDLEGISGDFHRRIWDHADHLVANVDLDHDGLKEIIVAADLQVYVFEDAGLFGGDKVRFVYSFDLRDTEWGDDSQFINNVDGITAMAAGNDVDSDGRGDLVVAAGPYLFIYNVNEGSFVAMEDNDYFVTTAVMEGRYYLIGNPMASTYQYARINAVTVGDTDKDGYREVLIGGVQDSRLVRQNGFAFIYECRGGTFYPSWAAPSEVTYWNPISVLAIDDQDYDGEYEIIIGHTNGFDMWEHVKGADNTYQKVEYVTASPNYPRVSLTTTGGGVTFPFGAANRTAKSLTQLRYSTVSNVISMFYENNSKLYAKRYYLSTGVWEDRGDQPLPYPGTGTVPDYEFEPHVSAWGSRIYVTWNTKFSANNTNSMYVTFYDYATGTWGPGMRIPRSTFEFGYRHSPSVSYYNSTHIALAYVLDFSFIGPVHKQVVIKLIDKDLAGAWASAGVYQPYVNAGSLEVHDAELIRVPNSDPEKVRFVIAMSATNPSLYKPDHDIWVAISHNNKLNFTKQYAQQATSSHYDEMYVDVDYLRPGNQSLVVLYENIDAVLEDRFGMVASPNFGATWGLRGYLNTIPDIVTRVEMPGGYVQYLKGGIPLEQPSAYAPAFTALDNGGFLYSMTFSSVYHIYQSFGNVGGWFKVSAPAFYAGINPQNDWALNNLHDVVDLDVGDTDSDARREVVVAFDHQYGVYELKSSTDGTGVMSYLEAYLSDEYENAVTGVVVSDSNGNGWDEIALSCERGDVFFFEYTDVSEGFAGFKGSVQNLTVSTSGPGMWANWDTLASYDLDNDGKEEVIASLATKGQVIAFDEDGTILWNNTDSTAGFNMVYLADVTNDTIPEVLLGGDDDTLWVLDITDGTEVWSYDAATGDVACIDVADADGDGWPEVAFGTTGDYIWLMHHDGTLYHSWSLALGDVTQITFGNYTAGENLTLAFIADTALGIMNPFNGTVLYLTPSLMTYAVKPVAFDVTEDGIDDVVFARNQIHILDPTTGQIIFNSSKYYDIDNLNARWNIWVDDFDDDGAPEIASYSPFGDVYLEDIGSGALQWHYNPADIYWTWDAQIGYAGGSGKLDIIISYFNASSASDGVTVALDGRSGVPLWFNLTGGMAYTVGTADIHGTGVDSAIVWDYFTHDITAVDGYERVLPEAEEAFPVHELYWTKEVTNATVRGTAVADLTKDGIDEIVVWYNVTVALLNGTNGDIIWTHVTPAAPGIVRIADMDGSGWLDVVVSDKNSDVYILKGEDGSQIGSVIHPTGFTLRNFYAKDFSATYDFNEVAVLWQTTTHVFVGWYNSDGALHFKSDFNISAQVPNMDVGKILGSAYFDVIIGGQNMAAWVFDGTDGTTGLIYDPSTDGYAGGYTINGILVGNFTGDAKADFVLLDSSSTSHIIDGSTNHETGYVYWPYTLRGSYAADLNGDGVDEFIGNVKQFGIVGFNSAGFPLWFWIAPILVSSLDSTCSFADMDGDGVDDLIFTNYGYLDVVSIVDNVLLWHYSSANRVALPKPGRFIQSSSVRDVVSYWGKDVYVVSGILSPPIPPASPAPLLKSANFSDFVAIAAMVGVPLVALLMVPVGLVWYRRRKRGE